MSTPLDNLAALHEHVSRLKFIRGTSAHRRRRVEIEGIQRLLEVKIVPEIRSGLAGPLIIGILGGTNTGKTSVLNALVGERLGDVDVRACHTHVARVFVHEQYRALLMDRERFFPGRPRDTGGGEPAADDAARRRLRLHFHDRKGEFWRRIALLDSPDIDGNLPEHHAFARELLYLSDVVLFVTDPIKYNDEACAAFVRSAVEVGRCLLFIINKHDPAAPIRDAWQHVLSGLAVPRTSLTPIAEIPFNPSHRDEDFLPIDWRSVSDALVRPEELQRTAVRKSFDFVRSRLRTLLEEIGHQQEAVEEIRRDLQRILDDTTTDYVNEFVAKEKRLMRSVRQVTAEAVDHRLRLPMPDRVREFWTRFRLGSMIRRLVRVRYRAPEEASAMFFEAERQIVEGKTKALVERTRRYLREGTGPDARKILWRKVRDDKMLPDVETCFESPEWHDLYERRSKNVRTRWEEKVEEKVKRYLSSHPKRAHAARVAKLFLSVSSGLLAAVLTGGFGSWDLVSAPLVALCTSRIVNRTVLPAVFADILSDLRSLLTENFKHTAGELFWGRIMARVDALRPEADAESIRRGLGSVEAMLR